jgi:hypothetical protein
LEVLPMDLQKAANLAQILSLPGIFPASYCAYGTWIVLHPKQAGGDPVNSEVLLISSGAFIMCATIGGIAAFVSRKAVKQPQVEHERTQEAAQPVLTEAESQRDRVARERMYEFFRAFAPDLYSDSLAFGNYIINELGDSEDINICLRGTLQELANCSFIAKYTELTPFIPPTGSLMCSLLDLQKKLDGFYDAYCAWAVWAHASAMLSGDLRKRNEFIEWHKADEVFLAEFKKLTVVTGLDFLSQQMRSRSGGWVKVRVTI